MRRMVCGLFVLVTACSGASALLPTTVTTPPTTTATSLTATTSTTATTTTTTDPAASTSVAQSTTTTADPHARPDWLGTRPLPSRPDGIGVAQPTPPELEIRQFETIDFLDPPTSTEFEVTIEPVPSDIVQRSTWSEECPIALDELRYVTMSFVGFDGELHTGEMIVNADVSDDVASVFASLFEADYPIEEMRVTRADELDAPPTGDGNDTESFVCRPVVGATSWSQHAYGLAIDVNPFQNPYLKGDIVIPELASSYVDRADVRPGMIFQDDEVVRAFAQIGWGWGGDWQTLKDWMHFSRNGR